jgi:ketosteroid isomerase-like protein
MLRIAPLLPCVLLLAAVALAAGPEDVLLQADRDFNQATQEKHLEGWMSYMADNVVISTGTPVVGKEAVRQAMQELTDPKRTLNWKPIGGEMFASRNMGYTTGRWTRTSVTEKGDKAVREGSYLTVWKKGEDGSWKVIFDTGAPDPAHALLRQR